MTVTLDPEGKLDLENPSSTDKPKWRKTFAIIGTRHPDEAQKDAAYHLAFALAGIGRHTVRTGAEYGIEQKAMEGTGGRNLEVYLPWTVYNRSIIPTSATVVVYNPTVHLSWTEYVSSLHPNPINLSVGAIALHARYSGLVLGCEAVIAFPGEADEESVQAIRVADYLKIPVISGSKMNVIDAPRWLGRTLQTLGLASKDLAVTIQGR